MRLVKHIIIIFLLFCCNYVYCQQISIDNAVPVQQLIQDNLAKGCIEISNVSTFINGSANGLSSYGYFDRAGSNFPFESGIVLATGDVASGGNTFNSTILDEGSSSWGTDPDLNTALGINNSLNATSIEFDFISVSNQIQFNYLFASEEYFREYPCNFSDGFVFLIRPTGSTGAYQNIALVPGTSTPVGSNTIHDEIFGICPAVNEQYFDGYNVGDTNYNGRTTVLSASASIVPYTQYHVKLIIADQDDYKSDSAVFIEANSFKPLDLGEDITTCTNNILLDGDIQNPQATYAWSRDGNLLSTETNPTLTVSQSGTYRLEITVPLSGGDCIISDEVIINITNELTASPISDYTLCDDLSGDGLETFDLSTKDSEVSNVATFVNYNFSYHYSDADARANINPITNPIQNTSGNPQTIYVRINDLDTGCLAFTRFDLVVNIIPNINRPSALDLCDDDTPDGVNSNIDLSQKDDEITGGNAALIVSYHYTPTDAANGDNAIALPYSNSNPSETLYARILNTQTGCINTTTLDLTVTATPNVNRETQYIDACDKDYDGFSNFDLTEVIADILQGLTGVTVTFHSSRADADADTNPIGNASNYQNIDPNEQVIYVRVEDDATGCPSIIPLEIHSNLLLTGVNIPPNGFAFCDEADNDGMLDVYLNTVANVIANGLNNVTITFFETQTDLDNNTNPIDTADPYTITSPHTLYIKIENDKCIEVSPIILRVNPVITFDDVNPIDYCDTDDDGITSIDLDSLDATITGGNTDFSVRYFLNPADADTGVNQLAPFYQNINNPETLYARIENASTGCFTVNQFQVNVIPAPSVSQPNDIIICDDDQDGISIINLEDKIPEIISDTNGIVIEFFDDLDNANTNTNPIVNKTAYSSDTQEIYVRIQSTEGNTCYTLITFNVVVNTLPIFPDITNFRLCEDDNDFTTDFYLIDKDLEILNGQTGKEVLYFEDSSMTSQIDKNAIYRNISSPQTIYVRVENISDTSCFGTSTFTIEVAPNPVYNDPTPYLICDDLSNDGVNTFDLNEKITEITAGSPENLTVSFHLSQEDALGSVNPQPLSFTNTSNPQSLYARIQNNELCSAIEEIGINIIPSPSVSDAQPYEQCDTNNDGFMMFDLTSADFEVLDRVQSDITVFYFENESDINPNDPLDNSKAISNPINYNSDSKTVFIKVTNTSTGCYNVIPLDLVVNMPQPLNTIGTLDICDNDTRTYDLSQVDGLLVNDLSSVSITYHNSQSDANNNLAPLSNIFNYTTNNHTIYVRAEDMINNCPAFTAFTLRINPIPIANTPPNMEVCDDDDDGFMFFDLTEQTNSILGSQNASNFTVTYYSSLENAQNKTNALGAMHSAFDGETIYARVENITTGCFNTSQFNTYVQPLPEVNVNDIEPLCINDLPLTIDAETGNTGDTYLWSTGHTSPQIQFGLEDVGEYWLTVTSQYGCDVTKAFSVVESAEATINFTTTVDFADPNSITVNVSGIGDYVYMLDYGPPQESNVFNNVTLGLHTVIIRDLNGCKDVEQEVLVIDAPKFMTPNADGFSDTWHIVGIEKLAGTVVYIYDRYGKLLKTLNDTSTGWDGTFRGQLMPSNDYWFLAKVKQDGKAFEVKGHFSLRR